MQFLTNSRSFMVIFRTLVACMVYLGAVLQMKLVWNMADLFMTLMALLNITAILLLRKQVLAVLADYRRQRAEGVKNPTFNPQNIPDIHNAQAWEEAK